ncbi:MAG TPA: glutamate-1-semialdehyde 2,1-aminomutase [Thermomicrobiales bacterium]|jgi:glutamate-1-semialdehyde 2,1-aminomutase|nr:glutamate-1-semialdehyde 2,1-aminomutase [Thermomicrobiales bacterium]
MTTATATRDLPRSADAFARARDVIPGGVNSPVRAFRGVGGTPVYYDHAAGACFTDLDGNEYLDYVMSWGPMILGHAHPEVTEAVIAAVRRGTSFGAPTEAETALAERIASLVPGVEQVRLVSSGTEATMSALRLARAATGRDRIVKFAGCYHGHADLLLVQAGSGVATFGLPDSPGVPAAVTADTLVAPYNDLAAVRELFNAAAERIAAIIVEPIAGNMGMVLPEPGFLQGLRDITREHGALLIFDEVMTGFRVALGGASTWSGVTADIVTLGKVVGGGFPLAAYAGPESIMRHVAPVGSMYQGGTLSGNPVATAAGNATLEMLTRPGVFDGIVATTDRLMDGIETAARETGVAVTTARAGAMGGWYMQAGPVRNYEDAKRSDAGAYARIFHHLLGQGVYVAPSQYEVLFPSLAHSDADIDRTIAAFSAAFRNEVDGGR